MKVILISEERLGDLCERAASKLLDRLENNHRLDRRETVYDAMRELGTDIENEPLHKLTVTST